MSGALYIKRSNGATLTARQHNMLQRIQFFMCIKYIKGDPHSTRDEAKNEDTKLSEEQLADIFFVFC